MYCRINKLVVLLFLVSMNLVSAQNDKPLRERISLNEGWKFYKYSSPELADRLIYDVRPEVDNKGEYLVADAKPTEAVELKSSNEVLKAWIMPTANSFIADKTKRYIRPAGNPGADFPFVQTNFDDNSWENVDLPHDWAIKGPFFTGWDAEVGGGMGRLPVNGVGWYRRKITVSDSDLSRNIFLDIDGAMSYAMVWLNGNLVGGWPYGYNSWRVDLTPYLKPGTDNQLAIRLDNPNYSARWYPGAGIYRNVWLTKTNKVHVTQWGTYITSTNVSNQSATIQLKVDVENTENADAKVEIQTDIYTLSGRGLKSKRPVHSFQRLMSDVPAANSHQFQTQTDLKNPLLWGPYPEQKPHLYLAVTTVFQNGKAVDTYETRFGIRKIEYTANNGLVVNGQRIQLKGVNQHHDLGAIGTAFNTSAARRQLVKLREMGCNAIRMSHNPPAPELLQLTDEMGFLVIDEIFDSWERKKTALDFHLIFKDWSEPDLRAFIRRDRNCPSVIMWSIGNEVGEQYTDTAGASVAKRLHDIAKQEDPSRPTTTAMNFAKPHMPLPAVADAIGLNYQGEGIRQSPEFDGTDRIRTAPQYNLFHQKFPDKMIYASETASAFSSRGVYYFPVSNENSSPVRDNRGGNSKDCQVSSYELYAVDFGSSADKVFASQDKHPFVAGEFVWTGWDHLGEPTPYYESRGAYCGIIDMAGFPKDRFYLYQSRWRPDFPMAHILPHWNWNERVGEITPVHVFTSGDEAELFLNGQSMGRKKKAVYEYRLRWDSIRYEPGELKVVAYKNSKKWAEDIVTTTGRAEELQLEVENTHISNNELAFVTVKITDANGRVVPRSNNRIHFRIDGPGCIVAADNGDATDLQAFGDNNRKAFNGYLLLIVRIKPSEKGVVNLRVNSDGLMSSRIQIRVE